MTDDELRALVRDAIQRHLGRQARSHDGTASDRGAAGVPAWRAHPSFGKFLNLPADDAGPCIIEPSVACNHCGFCKTYGH
jgi:hypothetical protein